MKHVYTSFLTFTLLTLTATGVYAQGPNDSGTYYAAADGKKGAELKTALCGIIRPGLDENAVSYTPSVWNAYPTTDARSDDNTKVWDMYSNYSDFSFGAPYQDTGKAYDKTKPNEGQYYNREHSWPNSWFGKQVQPMYTDLHHVYPTDKFVNAQRANNPFGETNGSWKSINDFSKLGDCTYPGYTGTVFEPNDIYKGDFARTYFYMVTCYEENIAKWYTDYGVGGSGDTKTAVLATLDGNAYPGLKEWQLNMLIKWSKNDPIDQPIAKETPRNNAVYAIQKNRNPFIDYPGLEEYIWGALKDVAFSYDHYQSPTAIMTIKAEPANKEGVMYNLAGQVVDKNYKGIVIMNGKKFYNK